MAEQGVGVGTVLGEPPIGTDQEVDRKDEVVGDRSTDRVAGAG